MHQIAICSQCLSRITSYDDCYQIVYYRACESLDHGTPLELLDECYGRERSYLPVLRHLERRGFVVTSESGRNVIKVIPKCYMNLHGTGLLYCAEPKKHLWNN